MATQSQQEIYGMDYHAQTPSAQCHQSSRRRRVNHQTIGKLFLLATAMAHILVLAAVGVSSESVVSTLRKGTSLRGSDSPVVSRRLNFLEKGNLFDRETNCECIETSGPCECSGETSDEEDAGIGGPTDIMGSLPSETIQENGEDDAISPTSKSENESEAETIPQFDDIQSETIQTTKEPTNEGTATEQGENGYFDGFEVTNPPPNAAESTSQHQQNGDGFFDGFEVTDPPPTPNAAKATTTAETSQQKQGPDGFFDGFEITNEITDPPSNIALSNTKQTQNNDDEDDDDDENDKIPIKDISIFVGLAVFSLVLYIMYYRDSVMNERLQQMQRDQAKMDRLKNLYADLDKYSSHYLDDIRYSSSSNSRGRHPPGSAFSHGASKRLSDSTIEDDDEIDFTADIEFAESSSLESLEAMHDDEDMEIDDDYAPALTVRTIRRNSAKEHWVQYSSDEFNINDSDSDTHSDSDSSDSGPII